MKIKRGLRKCIVVFFLLLKDRGNMPPILGHWGSVVRVGTAPLTSEQISHVWGSLRCWPLFGVWKFNVKGCSSLTVVLRVWSHRGCLGLAAARRRFCSKQSQP